MSAIATAALIFGFASCAGDLHDVENTPYTNAAKKVYVLGGISNSTMEASVEATKKAFDKTQSYEVQMTDGKIKFTFTYSGSDGWSAGDGATAFAIVADATSNWDAANKMRWMTGADGVSVGSSASLLVGSSANVKITGLSAGTQYTVEAELTAAGGTIKVTQGLSAVPFELVWLNDNGESTNASSATAGSGFFTYDITPAAEAKAYKFLARYGNDYYAPTADAEFTVDGTTTAEAAKGTAAASYKALKVTIPSATDAATDHVGSYKLKFVISEDKLTASVEKNYLDNYAIRYLNSSAGNKEIVWAASANDLGAGSYNGKPYSNKKVTLGTVKFEKGTSIGKWGAIEDADEKIISDGSEFQFGVCSNSYWTIKYTNARLEKEGVEYTLENGAKNNNFIKGLSGSFEKDLTITITYIVYENIFNAGKYENASEWKISYSMN